jgi:hypothetical protein
MLLSDLIAQLSDETAAHEALLRVADLALLAELRQRAEADSLSIGAYAARAISCFAAHATEEDWLTLMGAMNRTNDPSLVFLRHALAHAGSPESLSA